MTVYRGDASEDGFLSKLGGTDYEVYHVDFILDGD